MKKIFLIRHAKSDWGNHFISDFDRALSSRGKKDAPKMGEILESKKTMPNLIVSSPAKRAITTAKIFSAILNYPIDAILEEPIIYEATTQNLLDVINRIEDKYDSVLMFGHNPAFTVLANLLGDKYIDNMPTCAIVELALGVDTWSQVGADSGEVISFEYPKKFVL